MKNEKYLIRLLFLLYMMRMFSGTIVAQEDLLSMLEEDNDQLFTAAIFKTSRIINGHSIENTPKSILDIKISHRFGFIENGLYDLFGLDGATIRIGADYGVSDRLTIGGGRSSLEKTYDVYAKYQILRQSIGPKSIPFGMSYVATAAIQTLKFVDPEASNLFRSRLYYTHQILIARKFSEGFSLQITPSVVHRNWVATQEEAHDVFSLGIGGRQKLSKRVSINLEYFYTPGGQLVDRYRNGFSVGLDIETGGHVFQLHFTNSTSMIEKGFIAETTGDWTNGGVHFGFNISRVFALGTPTK
ncbi:MAG: hypothetical protein HKN87_18880 [Saprospiraceae bacterium]|nr:hypothetical protein [Saprospiraceae bacterium]